MTSDHTARRSGARSVLVQALLLAGCAAALSGCYSDREWNRELALAAAVPDDYRQRHPIVITEKDRTVQLFVGTRRGALTADQRADVLAFAQDWKREATGGIVIQVPTGSRSAAAARSDAHEARAMLLAAGIPPNDVVVRSYHLSDPSRLATVRLNYPRMRAEAGPCGVWPEDIGPTSAAYRLNKPYWNLGCASQRNLAAMVADPADLVQPRGEGPVYQARRTVVLGHYRAGEPTASTQPTDSSAKISDVGK